MCGRIVQSSDPLHLMIVPRVGIVEPDVFNARPRFNGAPGQHLLGIRQHPDTGERTLDFLLWGLIPSWTRTPHPRIKPINASAERIAKAPMFRRAYQRRRCIVPVDCFYEWQTIAASRHKQPYAVAMKDRKPFGIAGIWENWRHPETDEWIRTFAIITTDANALLRPIHDRMPVILERTEFDDWLNPLEPDPYAAMKPFLGDAMIAWPVSARVNSPANDDASLVEPLTNQRAALAAD